VRLEKNGKTYETRIDVGLDRRVGWTVADRKAQYEAALKVSELFNDESILFARIAGLREQVAQAGKAHPASEVARKLASFDAKLDGLRKQIVATTEGGAITGEERLREHTDQLYAAIISWDGPPSTYATDNAAALRQQLSEIQAAFDRLTSAELPAINKSLERGGGHSLTVPDRTALEDDNAPGAGGGSLAGRLDPDASAGRELPKDLRLWN
jgi:hypothetical protein